ncbi:MAG: glycolate oxidase subunit GlcE [Nevskia sp.]|jgi:glycolate oxidase FAD binding subunit|nr:glycolate oxidase subunit GlcE [Nevskia sp.]MCK9385097.1 glycolate oxidase subunit GlcE [Nevskia sp.]
MCAETPLLGADSELRAVIRTATERQTKLCLRGSGSKDFYGGTGPGLAVDLSHYRGIIDYAPEELVIVVRAGTPLAEVEAVLSEAGQMLPFEPPQYGGGGTIGGCIAAGLSGPRRPYAGASRDYVLGLRLIDGRGQSLQFGGAVIKNVAGYDVSRLMVGAMGTLGVLRDIALKVLPRPRVERTVCFACTEPEAIVRMNRWAGRMPALSASSHADGVLALRLSGSAAGVNAALRELGGELLDDAESYWRSLRDQHNYFFTQAEPLWRVSLPPTAPPLKIPLPLMIEWGGALRWLVGDLDYAAVQARVRGLGGHITAFRGAPRNIPVFQPLPPALEQLHTRIRDVFDPHRIFNPGRFCSQQESDHQR